MDIDQRFYILLPGKIRRTFLGKTKTNYEKIKINLRKFNLKPKEFINFFVLMSEYIFFNSLLEAFFLETCKG